MLDCKYSEYEMHRADIMFQTVGYIKEILLKPLNRTLCSM